MQQSVVLAAIRGCDGMPREDPSKILTRALRKEILYDADTRNPAFMNVSPIQRADAENAFLRDLDRYPMHWLMHFTHAVEIVGYKHPDADTSAYWGALYYRIVYWLHLKPESEEDLDKRLADCMP